MYYYTNNECYTHYIISQYIGYIDIPIIIILYATNYNICTYQ